jgi:hypothetical protein
MGVDTYESNNQTPVSAPTGQCTYIKPDGSPCEAHAQTGSNFCFFHDPQSAEERQLARIKGGRERSRRTVVLPPETPDVPLTTAAHITSLVAETISQVRRGELDANVGNCVGFLASVGLKALQRDGLEQRISRLESVLVHQRTNHEADFKIEFVNPEGKA